jgi:hypothetical protein
MARQPGGVMVQGTIPVITRGREPGKTAQTRTLRTARLIVAEMRR